MANEAQIEEIRQIMAQYQAEVGSKRRPWPESIKKRVFELVAMGLKMKAVSDKTGIPYHTILQWRQQEMSDGIFHSVSVTDNPNQVPTVTVPVTTRNSVGTVTVTTPDGYRIEAEYHAVVELIQRLRRGS